MDEERPSIHGTASRVRHWYLTHGLAEEDLRRHSDDHLVNELRFLAHLLGDQGRPAALAEAVRFMDEHPLRWVGRFAQRVAARCDTRFYAGLARLTAAYLEELRDLLASLLDAPRPTAHAFDTQACVCGGANHPAPARRDLLS